jgi:hypothetical protein
MLVPRQVKIVSESVAAPAREVYEFARPREQECDHWVVTDSPMGRIEIRMAPRNDFGVLDHDVTTPDGATTHNAFRVTPVDEGCALTFVVLRAAGADDDAFEKDAAHVLKDLRALKSLVEKMPG